SLFAPELSTKAMNRLLGLQLPCPTEQPFSCSATCRSGSTPGSQDCGAEAKKRLTQGDTITGGNCSNSAGPEPTCTASVNFCNVGNGTRGTISLTLNCNAPAPTPTPTPTTACLYVSGSNGFATDYG